MVLSRALAATLVMSAALTLGASGDAVARAAEPEPRLSRFAAVSSDSGVIALRACEEPAHAGRSLRILIRVVATESTEPARGSVTVRRHGRVLGRVASGPVAPGRRSGILSLVVDDAVGLRGITRLSTPSSGGAGSGPLDFEPCRPASDR